MLEIQLKKRLCHCPESWEECSPEQVRVFLLVRRIPAEERKRSMMEALVQSYLGLTDKEWRKLVLSFQQWNELKAKVAWVFELPVSHKPFDYFDFEGIRYFLPEPFYTNTSALEVSLANLYFLQFAHPTEPDLGAIDKIIATLCRPKRSDLLLFQASEDWNGDSRETFNQARMEATAIKFAGLDMATKVAFLSYFEQINTAFLESYAELFGSSSDEPRYKDGTGWLIILKNIAKGGIWGTFDNVCKQSAHTVWTFMLDDVLDTREEQTKREKEYENAKNNR